MSPLRAATVLLVISLGIGLVAGCGLVSDPAPSTARVVIDGTGADEVQLVVSTVFLAQDQTADFGRTLDVQVIEGDTLTVDVPFEATYDITRPQRFLAQVYTTTDTTSLEGIQVDGSIDGDRRFTRTATDTDSLVQFVYIYQGSTPPNDGRL